MVKNTVKNKELLVRVYTSLCHSWKRLWVA